MSIEYRLLTLKKFRVFNNKMSAGNTYDTEYKKKSNEKNYRSVLKNKRSVARKTSLREEEFLCQPKTLVL